MRSYACHKAWRLKNPKKRNAERKKYYDKHRDNPQNSRRSKKRWSKGEIERIISFDLSVDAIIAKEIGRSVEAIQVKRSKLIKAGRLAVTAQ
jgi:hypothetical protein